MGTLPLWRLPTLLMMMGEVHLCMIRATPLPSEGGECCDASLLAAHTLPCLPVSNIAPRTRPTRTHTQRRYCSCADGRTGTRRNSLAFPPLILQTGRHAIESISFRLAIIDARARSPSPIPSHLSYPLPSPLLFTSTSTLSFYPSVPYRRIQSARSNQSFNPNNAGGRRGGTV